MTWLRKIVARTLRHLEPLEIDLTPPEGLERLHLVLLGPNGSGKTSLLDGVADELEAAIDGRLHPAAAVEEAHHDPERVDREVRMAHIGRPVRLAWSDPAAVPGAFGDGRLILVRVRAPRQLSFARAQQPAPTDTDPQRPDVQQAARLPQLLLNRETEAALARQSGDAMRAKVHEAWQLRVRAALRRLLHQPSLTVASDQGGFHLDLPDGRRMHLDELSRGHASAVAVWAEVMMRVEAARLRADDPALEPAGVVLIDAVEADLDARLQRELLPALAELYPRVQLVVATHSPLVAMSLDDAVVYDLARRRGRPSLEVRREGVEKLLLSMLGLEGAPQAGAVGAPRPSPSGAPPPALRPESAPPGGSAGPRPPKSTPPGPSAGPQPPRSAPPGPRPPRSEPPPPPAPRPRSAPPPPPAPRPRSAPPPPPAPRPRSAPPRPTPGLKPVSAPPPPPPGARARPSAPPPGRLPPRKPSAPPPPRPPRKTLGGAGPWSKDD